MKQHNRIGYQFLCIVVLLLFSFYPEAKSQEYVDLEDDSTQTAVSSSDVALEDSSFVFPENIRRRLDVLVQDPIFERTQLGLYVYDLTSDTVVYARGEKQLLRPASTQKLLTAITALSKLGGSYRFETRLYYTGEVADSELNGDLYIVGGFDPRFGSDDMKSFIDALVRMGVGQINGTIYADVSMKDTLKYGSGWCWDDDVTRLTPLLYNGRDVFMREFFYALAEEHIQSSGNYVLGLCPAQAKLLASRFHTMDQILMRMMKKSDNLYAEAMFYQLGAQSGRRYPSVKYSENAVYDLIESLRLNPSHYRVGDGSGLSLYNYLTPELLVKMLRFAYHRNNIYLHLYPSLPIAGVDGTMSTRQRRGSAYDNVHAKTGTVEGVSSLAGYATASNGHILAFAIINQGIRHTSTGRNFQDRVCSVLTGL